MGDPKMLAGIDPKMLAGMVDPRLFGFDPKMFDAAAGRGGSSKNLATSIAPTTSSGLDPRLLGLDPKMLIGLDSKALQSLGLDPKIMASLDRKPPELLPLQRSLHQSHQLSHHWNQDCPQRLPLAQATQQLLQPQQPQQPHWMQSQRCTGA